MIGVGLCGMHSGTGPTLARIGGLTIGCLSHAVPAQKRQGFSAVVDAEFAVGAVEVVVDGLGGKTEVGGCLLLGRASAHEQQDFAFARGELFQSDAGRGGFLADDGDNLPGRPGGERKLAGMGCANAPRKRGEGIRFVDEAIRPGADGLDRQMLKIIGGDEQAAEAGMQGLDAADEFEAVHAAFAEMPVHEDNVGKAGGHAAEGGFGVGEFVQHGKVGLARQRAPQDFTGVLMVFHQTDGDACAHDSRVGRNVAV